MLFPALLLLAKFPLKTLSLLSLLLLFLSLLLLLTFCAMLMAALTRERTNPINPIEESCEKIMSNFSMISYCCLVGGNTLFIRLTWHEDHWN